MLLKRSDLITNYLDCTEVPSPFRFAQHNVVHQYFFYHELMNAQQTLDGSIEQLFRARKWALLSFVPVLLSLVFAGRIPLAGYALAISATVFCIASIASWFFIFRVVRPLHGTGYAIGHVVISILLTPALLTRLILIPLLAR